MHHKIQVVVALKKQFVLKIPTLCLLMGKTTTDRYSYFEELNELNSYSYFDRK